MLSFVVRRSSNKKIIAVSLNFDVVDEPSIPAPVSIQKVFDFLEFIESKQRYAPIVIACIFAGAVV